MTDTKSTVLLKHHLKQLKLPTMQQECEKVAQRCASDNADHLAYLLQLSELELIERERKAAERRLKAARFPAAKLLDEFDFAARPSVNKPLVLLLAKGDYLDKRENILLVGPSGTGKSHLATALGMAAMMFAAVAVVQFPAVPPVAIITPPTISAAVSVREPVPDSVVTVVLPNPLAVEIQLVPLQYCNVPALV